MKKNIVYIARNNKKLFPGVQKKIEQVVGALNRMGHDAASKIADSSPRVESLKQCLFAITSGRRDIIILRNDIFMPLFLLPLMWQKINGKKIIIDVPTPLCIVLNEIDGSQGTRFKKNIRKLIIRLAFPWSLWVADKVIHYAPESKYFSIGLEKKIQISGNGVDVSQIKMRSKKPEWPSQQFVMIGVASLADWHAFDRVIIGIANYFKENPESIIKPKFIIVGDGQVRANWQKLALDLGLNSVVHFAGYKTGKELDDLFEEAHVAISSLGLYRKKLKTASDLKSRDYSARGIPFAKGGGDMDFDPIPDFIFEVENSNDPLPVNKLIAWYEELCKKDSVFEGIREFALENLDFSRKAKNLIALRRGYD